MLPKLNFPKNINFLKKGTSKFFRLRRAFLSKHWSDDFTNLVGQKRGVKIFGYSIKSVLEILMFVFNFKTIFKQTLVAVLDLANFVSEVKNYYGLNLMNTFVTLESEWYDQSIFYKLQLHYFYKGLFKKFNQHGRGVSNIHKPRGHLWWWGLAKWQFYYIIYKASFSK